MITLHLQIKASCYKNELTTSKDGKIFIKIKAPATDGKANNELISFLSKFYNIPKSKIAITKGIKSPFKTVEIDADANESLPITEK